MTSTQFLAALPKLGVNVQDALARFMGNQMLYLSFLCRLPQSMDLEGIEQALRSGSGDDFYAKVHMMLGMASNLSIDAISHPTQRLLEEYRAHGLLQPHRLEALLQDIRSAAAPLTALIQQYEVLLTEGGHV